MGKPHETGGRTAATPPRTYMRPYNLSCLCAGAFGLTIALAGCSDGGTGAKTGSGGSGIGGSAGTAGSGIAGSATGGSIAGVGGDGGFGGVGGAPGPFANCTWTLGSGATIAGTAPTKNNSADLKGAALGDVPFASGTARRTVPVKVGMVVAGLQVGPAYLTQGSPTAPLVDLVIPVTNTGADYPCFISAQNLHYLNATGTILNLPNDSTFLYGSVGDVGTGYTHTCLRSGETGYFIVSQSATAKPFFTGTASIEMDLNTLHPGTAPTGHLTPKQYEIGLCDGVRTVRLTAVNDGSSTISVASGGFGPGPAVLLDADGLPAGWIFLEDDDDVQLAPGGTALFYSDLPSDPAVDRAQFLLDFDAPTGP